MTYADARISSVLDSLEKFIIRRFPSQGEGRVAYPALDMNADINFENITLLKNYDVPVSIRNKSEMMHN
jgi:hypothetical protein